MESLGKYLRRRRINHSAMTLRDLEDVSGVSRAMLSQCETGKARLSDKSAVRLERALKIQQGELRRRLKLAKTPPDVLALIPPDALEQYVSGRKAS